MAVSFRGRHIFMCGIAAFQIILFLYAVLPMPLTICMSCGEEDVE